MTPQAFVLIKTEFGSEKKVLKEVKKVDGVKEAHPVYGHYDIMARVYGKNDDELNERIVNDLRKLDNVESTLTMRVI